MPLFVEGSSSNPATVGDLESRWRPLTPAESPVAEALLGDAWAMLSARVVDLQDRLGSGALDPALVVAVESAMVLRVLRNPDGKRQESIDDYSYTLDAARSAGALYVTDDELRLLGGRPKGGAFTITPGGATALEGDLATRTDLWFQYLFSPERPS